MKDYSLLIRPATYEDVTHVIALIRLSMGAEVDWLFGQEEGHPTDDVLAGLFHRKGNRTSHDVCWVAEIDGLVVGALLAYPGKQLRRLELRTGLHLIQIFGLLATIRLARRQPVYGQLVEAEADEFYISNVAVSPLMQGMGIGAMLMTHADALARSAGLSKCSLIVTFDNPARHLYERCGYGLAHSYEINHPVIAHGSGGFHRMVKMLAASTGD